MNDERDGRRRVLGRRGEIRFDGEDGPAAVSCLVKDVSATGAQLLVSAAGELPPEFNLSVAGIIRQDCLVVWRQDGRLGVEFIANEDGGR